MKLMRTLLWAVVLVPALLSAQPTQEEARRMARSEATRQGVDPDALEARLQARGVNTTTLTMSDIPRVQPIVEEEIAKMKAEQSAATNAKANETVETGGEVIQSVNELTDTPEPLVVEKAVVVTEAPTKTIVAPGPATSTNVFGHQIFSDGSLSLYEVSKDYIPNDSYILGPGDVVTVSIFGKS